MGQVLLLQKGHGLLTHPLFFRAVKAEGGGKYVLLGPHVLGDEYIFKHRQGGEQTDILEGPGDAQVGDPVGRGPEHMVGEGVGIGGPQGLGPGGLRLVVCRLKRAARLLIPGGLDGGQGLRVVQIGVGGVEGGVLSGVALDHLALGVVADHGLPQKVHPAVGGLIHSSDAVEGSGLAGTVGADQGHDLP